MPVGVAFDREACFRCPGTEAIHAVTAVRGRLRVAPSHR